MKLKCRFKFEGGELGRECWVTGTAINPAVGSIYCKYENAPHFTAQEIDSIVDKFAKFYKFESVN